jgi:CRISPR-associated protein Cmr5
MSNQNTLEQGRATFALISAKAGKDLGSNGASEYQSYVRKLPMLIKNNGLGPAMAFVFSKGAKNGEVNRQQAWGLLYGQISQWLGSEAPINPLGKFSAKDDTLINKIIAADAGSYRLATVETLALLSWLRRFVDGLID